MAFYLDTKEQQPTGYSSDEAGEVEEGFVPCLHVTRASIPEVFSQQRGHGANEDRVWTAPLSLELILSGQSYKTLWGSLWSSVLS